MQHITLDSPTANAVIVDGADGPRVFVDAADLAMHFAFIHYNAAQEGIKSDDYLAGFGDVVIAINQTVTLNLANDEMGA